jgi:hypothetical protein
MLKNVSANLTIDKKLSKQSWNENWNIYSFTLGLTLLSFQANSQSSATKLNNLSESANNVRMIDETFVLGYIMKYEINKICFRFDGFFVLCILGAK